MAFKSKYKGAEIEEKLDKIEGIPSLVSEMLTSRDYVTNSDLICILKNYAPSDYSTIPIDNVTIYWDRGILKSKGSGGGTQECLWELKENYLGEKYLYSTLPVVTKYGITTYSDTDVADMNSEIWLDMPIDNDTIYWSTNEDGIRILKAKGGSGGEGGTSELPAYLAKLFKGHFDNNGNLLFIEAMSNIAVNGGLTLYYDNGGNLPTLFDGLPIDGITITWKTIIEDGENKNVLVANINENQLQEYLDREGYVRGGFEGNIDLSDFATVNYVKENYVNFQDYQYISGIKNFINGLEINGIKIHKSHNDVLYIDSNVVIRGGLTTYSSNSEDFPSILDSLPIASTSSRGIASFDSEYFEVDNNGRVTLKQYNYTEGLNEEQLRDYLTSNRYTTKDWVLSQGYVNKSVLTEELKKYVTIDGNQDIIGIKNFVNGLQVGGINVYKSKEGVIYIDSNVVIKGGLTTYSDENADIPSLIESLPIASNTSAGIASFDSNYFIIDTNGKVTLKEIEYEAGIDEEYLKEYLKDYATQDWVRLQGYATASSVKSLQDKLNTFLEGTDTDNIINKWKELETFLLGLSETDKLTTLLSNKADISYVNSTFVTIAGNEDITGIHNFVNGFKVGGITFKNTNGVVYIDGDIILKGGITSYSSDTDFDTSSVMESLLLDSNTLGINDKGQLYVKGGTGGDINIDTLTSYLNDNNYVNNISTVGSGNAITSVSQSGNTITFAKSSTFALASALNSYAKKSTTLSGYGITNAYTKTETDGKYLAKSNGEYYGIDFNSTLEDGKVRIMLRNGGNTRAGIGYATSGTYLTNYVTGKELWIADKLSFNGEGVFESLYVGGKTYANGGLEVTGSAYFGGGTTYYFGSTGNVKCGKLDTTGAATIASTFTASTNAYFGGELKGISPEGATYTPWRIIHNDAALYIQAATKDGTNNRGKIYLTGMNAVKLSMLKLSSEETEVLGKLSVDDVFISKVADGTAPMTITSTTKVANLHADMVDGFSIAANGMPYQSIKTASDTTGETWYLKVKFNRGWNSGLQHIEVAADYNNTNGKVLLELDSYNHDFGFRVKVSSYNNCNCTGFCHSNDASEGIGYLYLRFVGYSAAYAQIKSTIIIDSVTKIDATEADSIAWKELSPKIIRSNYKHIFDWDVVLGGNFKTLYDNKEYITFQNHNNGNISLSAATGDLHLGYVNTNSVISQKNLTPVSHNTLKLGVSDKRWQCLYSVNGDFSSQVSTKTLKVNGGNLTYDSTNKYWKLEGDLLVTGGVTMFGSDSTFTPSTIMDGVLYDNVTIKKNASGALYVANLSGAVTDAYTKTEIDNKLKGYHRGVVNYTNASNAGDTTTYPEFLGYASGLPSGFHWIETKFYQEQTAEKNRMQIAYGYDSNYMAYRRFKDGSWKDWKQVAFVDDIANNYYAKGNTLTVGDGTSTIVNLQILGSTSKISIMSFSDGINYFESHTKTGTNAPLKITGSSGGLGSDLYLLFNNIYCRDNNYINLDSGNYSSYALPLSGGTLTGHLTIKSTTTSAYKKLVVGDPDGYNAAFHNSSYTSSSREASISWMNGTTTVGSIGVGTYPFYHNGTHNYKILHEGNYADYALPLTGGALTGSLVTNAVVPGADNTYSLGFSNYRWAIGHFASLSVSSDDVCPLIINRTHTRLPYIGFALNGKNGGYIGGSSDGNMFMQTGLGSETTYSVLKLYREGKIELQTQSANYDVYTSKNLNINKFIYAPNTTTTGTSEETGKSSTLTRTTFWRDNNISSIGLTILHSENSTYGWQIRQKYTGDTLYVKRKYNDVWQTEKEIAFTTSNVASATKLETARTIWGQSFNGSADVVGSIFMNNDNAIVSKDTSGTNRSLIHFNTNNAFSIGYGTSAAGYETYIDGSTIYLRYGTAHNTGIVLNSSGNVTIGSSNKALTDCKLYIEGVTNSSNNIVVQGSTENVRLIKVGNSLGSVSLYVGTTGNRGVYDSTVSKWIIYSNGTYTNLNLGNVGVGNTDPKFKLDVSGGIGGTSVNIYGSEVTDKSKALKFLASDKSSRALMYYKGNTTDGLLCIESLYSDVAIITNTGKNVGIGTTTPSCKLHVVGDILSTGGITMYSDIRKKTKLKDVELSVNQIANAPLIEHYYNSDKKKITHVGSIAQYWAGLNDWFCKKDNEGFYTMEIQNAALASAISIARELVKFESETDRRIRILERENRELKREVKKLKKLWQ